MWSGQATMTRLTHAAAIFAVILALGGKRHAHRIPPSWSSTMPRGYSWRSTVCMTAGTRPMSALSIMYWSGSDYLGTGVAAQLQARHVRQLHRNPYKQVRWVSIAGDQLGFSQNVLPFPDRCVHESGKIRGDYDSARLRPTPARSQSLEHPA